MTLINVEHLIRCSTLSDWSMHLIRCDVQRSPNCIVIEIAHACFFGTPEDENKIPQPINYWNNILNELSIINILKDLKVNYQIEKWIINLSMNYIYFRILLFYLKIGLCYPHPVSWPSVHQGEWRLSLATSPCLRIQLGHGNPSLSLAVSENFGEKS